MANIRDNKNQKGLQSQLNKLLGEIDALRTEVTFKQRELSNKNNVAKSLMEKIKELDSPIEPTITEHALLRYFERVKGYDLEIVKKEILSDKVKEMIAQLGGSGAYPNGKYKLMMKDNKVVTIVI